MKISSASKKVLASALSAAMVVAFAPVVAFGAQPNHELTVNYDLAGGTDANAGNQYKLDAVKVATVDASSDITLQSVSDGALQLNSGVKADGTADGYAFKAWAVSYDANADGTVEQGEGGLTVTSNKVNVASEKILPSTPLYAKAVYDAATLTLTSTVSQYDAAKKAPVVKLTGGISDTGKVKGTAKFVVTAPDGTVTEKASLSAEAFAAQVGEWTVALVDGNGVTLDTKKTYVGSFTLNGAAMLSYANDGTYVTSQKVFFIAPSAETTMVDVFVPTYVGDLNTNFTKGYKITTTGAVDTATTATDWFTADGESFFSAKVKAGKKGAADVALNAFFGDVALNAFTYKNGALSAAVVGTTVNWATAAQVKEPEKVVTGGEVYYLNITDDEGKVIAESADADDNDKNNGTLTGNTLSVAKDVAGTYTATLYKITPGSTTAGADTTAGKIEVVETKTVTVAEQYAASPAWAYTAAYKTDGTDDGGQLVLTNAAGEGYDVYYTTDAGTAATAGITNWIKYDPAKGGIKIAAAGATTYYFKASNGNTAAVKADATKLFESKVTKLIPYGTAKTAFDGLAAGFNTVAINGKVGTYYAQNADVKAAIAAADKAFTDAGFEASKVVSGAETAWSAAGIAAQQSVVDAVVGVAKAEVAKLATLQVAADGSGKMLTAEAAATATKAIEKVSADFALNHDDVTTNNVAGYAAAIRAYVDKAEAELEKAAGQVTKFSAADVAAAAAVTAQLQSADAAAAKAGLEAYAALNATQKQLVAIADVAAAQAVVKAAAEAEAAAQLVKEQDLAAVKYVNNPKTKTVKLATAKKGTATITYKSKVSASGNAVTYAKVSGAKIKVAASGKVTLKKVTKKGTYTGKVKVTCGDATRTVKVKFIVK